MWKQLIKLQRMQGKSLQIQIREQIVSAILSNIIQPGQSLPSSRELSKELSVSRNTIVLAYDELESEGYLIAISRKGYFVAENIFVGAIKSIQENIENDNSAPDWCQNSLVKKPSTYENIKKCGNWKEQEYPFVYGQLDPNLIPINDWREAVKQSLTVGEIRKWNVDHIDGDDSLLIEQIQSKVLPRRGIWASEDEILLTAGSQNAMYLVTSLLVNEQTSVGLENPCYPDFKNMLLLKTKKLVPLKIDDNGVVVDKIDKKCNLVYTTPSHQFPTGVTMSRKRRKELLAAAEDKNFVIIEDDYDAEISFTSESRPALKSIDKSNRVIYIGSFSKSFGAGLRMGYIVAPREFIKELRELRRLMQRHLPANNQRAIALFISLGHYHSMFNRIHAVYKERWQIMSEALAKYPFISFDISTGGSSFWVTVPSRVDTKALCKRLLEKGVVLEPGEFFYMQEAIQKAGVLINTNVPTNKMRLAYSSIPSEKIERGISIIADEIIQMAALRKSA